MITAGLVKGRTRSDRETECIQTSFILMQPEQTTGDKECRLYYFKTGHTFPEGSGSGSGSRERYMTEQELSLQDCSSESPSHPGVPQQSNVEQKQKCCSSFTQFCKHP